MGLNHFVAGYLIGGLFATGILVYDLNKSESVSKILPGVKEVQQGYILPKDLTIKCEDLDNDGKLETIVKLGDRSYLFKEVNGKPVLTPYSIKPAEEIPAEIIPSE